MSAQTKKVIIRSTVAGLALLGLTAIPVFAQNRHQSETSSASETTLAQAQTTPTKAQMNQMMERCNSMMKMMNNNGNMPRMMNGQNNKSEQGTMNRTTGQ